MRILHVVGGLNRGGAETSLMHILRHIDREKYDIDFLVHTEKICQYDEEAISLGARIIPCLTPDNPVRYAYNFHRIVRRYGPYQCVHSHVHQFSGLVLALAAAEGVPARIVHSRTDTRLLDAQSSWVRRAYVYVLEKLIHRYATLGIAVSQEAALSLFPANWKSENKWSVCPSGIDLTPFDRPVDADAVRGELGIPPGAPVIGHVGRFVEVKNHRFLIEIAQALIDRDSKAILLLVGDGPLRPEIEGLARSRGLSDRVIFAGIRNDIPRLMKGAMDCFVLPSAYEGLPIVLLEAQAAGLPSVVSSTVSSDGDIGDAAVARVLLSEAASVWADHLQAALCRAEPFVVPDSWKRVRSIEAGTERIEKIYSSLACVQ